MPFKTREECIEAGKKAHRGTFWINSGVAPKPSDFVRVDRMIEDMRDYARDEVGDAADDFPDMPRARQAELVRLIEELLDAHVDMTFVVMNDDAEEITRDEP